MNYMEGLIDVWVTWAEIGWTCEQHVADKQFIRDFCEEISWKMVTWKTEEELER